MAMQLPRQLLRPRALVAAVITFLLFVGIITFFTEPDLGHVALPPTPQSAAARAAAELSKPKVDLTGELIEPEPVVEIQRSFEEPDFALLSSKQPHEIGCDVPVDWRGEKGQGPEGGVNKSEDGVLVLLGVFSAGAVPGKSAEEMKARRDLYRKVYWPDFPDHLVAKKFILGMPPQPPHELHPAAQERVKAIRLLHEEAEEFGDMVFLDIEDNVDSGKTHAYFSWVAKEYGGPGRVKGRPRFVMKTDDDTLLVAPNMISAFRELDCSTNIYWGTSAGRSAHFGQYFRGLAYAMSWPLVSWIGSAAMPEAHVIKIEDARTGQWLRHLDSVDDPLVRIDNGWAMADWNQIDVTIETMALHWCKWDEWVVEQHDRILDAWRTNDRPYDWKHGVDPLVVQAKGHQVSESALKEYERQKEQGWDVNRAMLEISDEDDEIEYGT